MRFLFFICFSAIAWVAVAQTVIQNKKTRAHKQVAGTQFFLRVPEGFVKAQAFAGFAEPKGGASISVSELTGGFETHSSEFNDAAFQSGGVSIIEKKDILFQGMKGFWIKANRFSGGVAFVQYFLVTGDDFKTWVLNGTCPRYLEEMEAQVIKSIQSAWRDADLKVDPQDGLSFSLRITDSPFALVSVNNGTATYRSEADSAVFRASFVLAETRSVNRKLASINFLNRRAYQKLEVDENSAREIVLDDLHGWEISAKAISSTGRSVQIYQITLFSGNNFYHLIGESTKPGVAFPETFRKVFVTFKKRD